MRNLSPILLALLGFLWAGPGRANPMAQCRAAISAAEREINIPAGLLHAISRVESGRRDPETGEVGPWPWVINAEGQGRFFPDKPAAIAAVRELQARGVRIIDVGCMQVNLFHHATAFANLEEAFDPAANARYAARFLNRLYEQSGNWETAAGHYHSQTPDRAEGYRARVLAAWTGEQTRLASSPPAPAAPSMLANRTEQAQVIPVATPGRGRGLDAYRAAPVYAIRATPPAMAMAMAAAQPRPSGPIFTTNRSAGPLIAAPMGARGGLFTR